MMASTARTIGRGIGNLYGHWDLTPDMYTHVFNANQTHLRSKYVHQTVFYPSTFHSRRDVNNNKILNYSTPLLSRVFYETQQIAATSLKNPRLTPPTGHLIPAGDPLARLVSPANSPEDVEKPVSVNRKLLSTLSIPKSTPRDLQSTNDCTSLIMPPRKKKPVETRKRTRSNCSSPEIIVVSSSEEAKRRQTRSFAKAQRTSRSRTPPALGPRKKKSKKLPLPRPSSGRSPSPIPSGSQMRIRSPSSPRPTGATALKSRPKSAKRPSTVGQVQGELFQTSSPYNCSASEFIRNKQRSPTTSSSIRSTRDSSPTWQPRQSRRRKRQVSPNLNTTPLGTHLDYEYHSDNQRESPPAASVNRDCSDISSAEASSDDSSRNIPTSLSSDLRSRLKAIKRSTKDLRNRLNARTNADRILQAELITDDERVNTSTQAVSSRRPYHSKGCLPDQNTFMSKMFITKRIGHDATTPAATAGNIVVTKEVAEIYESIKRSYQDVPGCTRAMFDEEVLELSILVRIRTLCNGKIWFIGSKLDHGPRMIGDTRTEEQRVNAVLRSLRQDYMRFAGLWDLAPIENVALTFHPKFFEQGSLLTNCGGIPGCPDRLTAIQIDACRTSMEDIGAFNVEMN
jgi:hypothetical protein